jgi:hypothetical protein
MWGRLRRRELLIQGAPAAQESRTVHPAATTQPRACYPCVVRLCSSIGDGRFVAEKAGFPVEVSLQTRFGSVAQYARREVMSRRQFDRKKAGFSVEAGTLAEKQSARESQVQ